MQDKEFCYRTLPILPADRCRKILCRAEALLSGRGWGCRVHLQQIDTANLIRQ